MKLFLFLLIFINYLHTEEFFIDEPILNSNIYINIEGDEKKDAIVFVHGLGDEASTIWENSIDKLKNDYYVIRFDLPGFGKSSKANVEYTPEKYAEVLDFIVSKYLNEKKFYLVGHSMGGAISLRYAMKYPNNLKKLMVIDSAGILQKDAYGEFIIKTQINKIVDENKKSSLNNQISQLASNITSSLTEILPKDLGEVVRDETIRKKVLSTPTSIAALGVMTEDWFDLYKIKTPTMILWGENDQVTPLRSAYVLNYLLENSELNIIKNTGHVPIVYSEDEYFEYLDKFLIEDIVQTEKKYGQATQNRELKNNKGILRDCSYKYLKIINSNNLYLYNCNIEHLNVENSNIYIIDSEIGNSKVAINSYNSDLNITSTIIRGEVGINTTASKLDLAAVKIDSTINAILSNGENEIIFSLVNIKSPKINKVFHKKIIMHNKEKY